MAGQWSGLVRFLDDPRIPLETTTPSGPSAAWCSGARITTAHARGAGPRWRRSCYSFIESAKLNGLEPKAYLRMAVMAALHGERIPLPHEVAAQP
jgi:hypothetical protein